jgi:hypothetical protein
MAAKSKGKSDILITISHEETNTGRKYNLNPFIHHLKRLHP